MRHHGKRQHKLKANHESLFYRSSGALIVAGILWLDYQITTTGEAASTLLGLGVIAGIFALVHAYQTSSFVERLRRKIRVWRLRTRRTITHR
jgi:uncharacterized membrane protein HdeD (DUF308 family)